MVFRLVDGKMERLTPDEEAKLPMRARIRAKQLAELDRLEAAELADSGKIELERMRLECEK